MDARADEQGQQGVMTGPLAPFADGYREELPERGYAPLSTSASCGRSHGSAGGSKLVGPTPELRKERERSRLRLHLVTYRSILKDRVLDADRVWAPGLDGRPVRGRWALAADGTSRFPSRGASTWTRALR